MIETLIAKPPVRPLDIIACARQIPNSPTSNKQDVKVTWRELDISDDSNISAFAAGLKESNPDGIDVLINNAGANLDIDNAPGIETSRKTLDINYFGTIKLTQAMLPMMQGPTTDRDLQHRRIVVVSSVGSKGPSPDKRRAIVACESLDQISQLGNDYLLAVEKNQTQAQDWPHARAYGVSKAMLNGAVRILASQHKHLNINACCPGWCSSDMGKLIGRPSKTSAEGARVPLNLAFGQIGDISGEYWENPSVSDKGHGQPSDWTK